MQAARVRAKWRKWSRQNGTLGSINQAFPALGRKNYLFAGSHEAAKRSGMLYSLLGTCKMHGIEPYGWLKDVLHRIADHPINKIEELLPHHYKQLS